MPLCDAVMLDLDGTLADTLEDIAQAANHALTALGRPAIAVARYRYLAGQGLQSLMTEALGPEHAGLAGEGMRLFREFYAEHDLDHTGPFPGMPEALDEMARRGLPLAVLSNKPHAATRRLVDKAFARWRFAAVLGQRDHQPLKPDPAGALEIARQVGVAPDRWLYVGDTRVDMETARAAGMFALGVLWGFRDEPELRAAGAQAIIRHPSEMLAFVRQ